MATLLAAVQDAAKAAGAVAARHFRTRLAVETKADGSPVTVADRQAERAAREWIEARYPLDGILGEELGETRADARRRWTIDPIDGTKSYVRGVPLYGAMVAVVEGQRVLAGCIYCPSLDELVAAAPGQGCWWNGSRCAVSTVSRLEQATVLTTDERFAFDDVHVRGLEALGRGGGCEPQLGRLLWIPSRGDRSCRGDVGRGAEPVGCRSAVPIIEEAGGVFTDWRGRRSPFNGSAVATNRGWPMPRGTYDEPISRIWR